MHYVLDEYGFLIGCLIAVVVLWICGEFVERLKQEIDREYEEDIRNHPFYGKDIERKPTTCLPPELIRARQHLIQRCREVG